MRFALTLAAALVALFAVAPAAAQMACTGGSCGEAGCLCSALSNSGEACGYHGTMGANCSGCHNCPGSGWIMGTGNTVNGRSGTCTAICSSADSEWTDCGHPVPPAGSVTKTACNSAPPSIACVSASTGENIWCKDLPNGGGEACAYLHVMQTADCTQCHTCPGGWIMGVTYYGNGWPQECPTAVDDKGWHLPPTRDEDWALCGLPAPGQAGQSGSGSPGLFPAICKENVTLSTADVSSELLGRANCATRTSPSCTELTAGVKKDSFYEHTTFGTICCGSRANVRCLDSSSMCKDGFYKPFYAAPEWEGKNCAFFDGFLLSRFDGTRVNWGDITCEELAAAKYNNEIPLGVDTMSDALNIFAACCGGQANLKCSFGNRQYGYSGMSPLWPFALMLAVLGLGIW